MIMARQSKQWGLVGWLVLSLTGLMLVVGCNKTPLRTDNDNPEGNVGEEGGPCYTNHTCDTPLVCNSHDICVSIPESDLDLAEPDQPVDQPTDQTEEPDQTTDDPVDLPEESVDEPADEPADVPEEQQVDEPVDEPTDEPVEQPESEEAYCGPVPGWPPDMNTNPWWSGRECRLPLCDEGVVNTCYVSGGTWRQTLTTVSHTCGTIVQTFEPRLVPGHQEVIEGNVFNTVGECDYHDQTLVGVVKGPTGISCSVTQESNGMGGFITIVQTGVATAVSPERLEGTARAFMFDLPMGTPPCYADYLLLFERTGP